MKEKKLIDIVQELRELYPNLERESEEKILEVFQNLQGIQKQALPSSLFKKSLKTKLETLHGLSDTEIQSIQNTRFSLSLLSGLFASFVFVAGFFYVMQGILFENPITKETLELKTFTGEMISEGLDKNPFSSEDKEGGITQDTPVDILRADDVIFDGIQNPYKKETLVENKTNESLSGGEALNGEQDNSQEIPIQENSGIDSSSPANTRTMISGDAINTQESSQNDNDSGENTPMMMKSSLMDSPAMDSPMNDSQQIEQEQGMLFMQLMSDAPEEAERDEFQDYCTAQGGSFDINNRMCTKGENSCNENQYRNNSCTLDVQIKSENNLETQGTQSQQGGGL